MRFIARMLFSAIAVLLISVLLSGVEVENMTSALIVAILLAFLNAYLKPLLILLTIPITLISFGLFLLVINAIIILFADYLIDGFRVDGFWWALFFSFLLSFSVSIFDKIENKSR